MKPSRHGGANAGADRRAWLARFQAGGGAAGNISQGGRCWALLARFDRRRRTSCACSTSHFDSTCHAIPTCPQRLPAALYTRRLLRRCYHYRR